MTPRDVQEDGSRVVGAARLEYRLALDLIAAAVTPESGGGVLIGASTTGLVRESLLRFSPATLLLDGCDERAVAVVVRELGLEGKVVFTSLREDRPPLERHAAAVWVCPQPRTWRTGLARIDQGLQGGAALAVLFGGAWMWLLGCWRAGLEPGEPGLPIVGLARALRQRAFAIEARLGVGRDASLAWATVAALAARLGRADLEDRCRARQRDALASFSSRLPSCYTVVLARKGG